MKELREQQTMIDQLQNHILAQDRLVNAQNNVIQEQDKKIIDLAFDFEYQKHSNKLLNAKMDETLWLIAVK